MQGHLIRLSRRLPDHHLSRFALGGILMKQKVLRSTYFVFQKPTLVNRLDVNEQNGGRKITRFLGLNLAVTRVPQRSAIISCTVVKSKYIL
jgi:hypothetical protein